MSFCQSPWGCLIRQSRYIFGTSRPPFTLISLPGVNPVTTHRTPRLCLLDVSLMKVKFQQMDTGGLLMSNCFQDLTAFYLALDTLHRESFITPRLTALTVMPRNTIFSCVSLSVVFNRLGLSSSRCQ